MADWKEPKNDYVVADQVTPDIFNELAQNEIHLKEITCHVQVKSKSGMTTTTNGIVLVEV